MITNFPAALAFIWRPGFDDPADQPHVTPGDAGGLTAGGITQATWDKAVRAGLVKGSLATAARPELSVIYERLFWGIACDALPGGLDLLLFNGTCMTGRFPRLFQQCLGFMGDDVDGWIGPDSLKAAQSCDPGTFVDAVCGCHAAYLSGLLAWSEFGGGWTARIKAVRIAARAMVLTPMPKSDSQLDIV
jgi:lysozyme family protein